MPSTSSREEAMDVVDLTILRMNGHWTIKLRDERGTQYLGVTDSRSTIEAFAARLVADVTAAGRRSRLTVETEPRSNRPRAAAKARSRADHARLDAPSA
jgi:hypothetical protein